MVYWSIFTKGKRPYDEDISQKDQKKIMKDNPKTSKNALKSIAWERCAICLKILQKKFEKHLCILKHPPIIL